MIATSLDPAACSLAELTEHIRITHHAFLRGALPEIWELLRELAAQSTPAAGDLRPLARTFARFRSTLENHLRKEEDVLFPFVEQLERNVRERGCPVEHAFGPLRLPIEILEAEHALGDRLLDRMRQAWRRWTPEDGSTPLQIALATRFEALDADMVRHVHVEDAVLFPRTIHLEGR